jgi:hypothetical protein
VLVVRFTQSLALSSQVAKRLCKTVVVSVVISFDHKYGSLIFLYQFPFLPYVFISRSWSCASPNRRALGMETVGSVSRVRVLSRVRGTAYRH